jgi:hypothetical protein
MPSRVNPQTALINSSASGNVTIVTNASTGFLYVWDLYLVSGGTANITFYNGAGALTGPMPVVVNSIINPHFGGYDGPPLFTIDPGAKFIVNDSAGVQKSGWCIYST